MKDTSIPSCGNGDGEEAKKDEARILIIGYPFLPSSFEFVQLNLSANQTCLHLFCFYTPLPKRKDNLSKVLLFRALQQSHVPTYVHGHIFEWVVYRDATISCCRHNVNQTFPFDYVCVLSEP